MNIITKKMILSALGKDIKLLKGQQQHTLNYIRSGCGQFLNVGSDQWNGNYEEVLVLFEDLIKWANKIKIKLNSLKREPKQNYLETNKEISSEQESNGFGYIDFIYNSYEKSFNSSDSLVFLDSNDMNPLDSCHHTLFPNLSKLIKN